MLGMFPNLANRADTAAGVLSGGEKQMLTICRTLMGDPELVMIDEPTEGLAPLIVQQVGDLIAEIARRGDEQRLPVGLAVAEHLARQRLGEAVVSHSRSATVLRPVSFDRAIDQARV